MNKNKKSSCYNSTTGVRTHGHFALQDNAWFLKAQLTAFIFPYKTSKTNKRIKAQYNILYEKYSSPARIRTPVF